MPRFNAIWIVVLAALALAGHFLGDSSASAGELVGWGRQAIVGTNDRFVAISDGAEHCIALRADGTLVTWGYNYENRRNVPSPNADFLAIAAGGCVSLGLKSDHSIVAWGHTYYGECNVPAPNVGFESVAAGNMHALAIRSSGAIAAWGNNDYSQCSVPAPNSGYIAVAAGLNHSLGLKQDGSIVAWGQNVDGQCNVPSPNTGYVSVAGGGFHSLGIRSGGQIAAWGKNDFGQCSVPGTNSDFISVAAGESHSLGLRSDGTVVAWGRNDYGQCDVPLPNVNFIAISAGRWHSLGLKADGTIVAWGYTGRGQCDIYAIDGSFRSVAASDSHCLGLTDGGSIVAWGNNSSGQCMVPEPNANFSAVAAGVAYSLGLKYDGSIVAWGNNDYGQCNVPSPNTGFTKIAAGPYHVLGLKNNGSVVAWGSNVWGQCRTPIPNADFVDIAAGSYHSLARRTNGTVAQWGSYASEAYFQPSSDDVFLAIAASGHTSFGLKPDGTLKAWGAWSMDLFPPAPATRFVTISGGNLAIAEEGTLVAWGDNSFGQLYLPAPNGEFTDIAAYGGMRLALQQAPAPSIYVEAPGSVPGQIIATPGPCTVRWRYSGAVSPDHYVLEYRTADFFPWRTFGGSVRSSLQMPEITWDVPPIGTDSLQVRVTAVDAAGVVLASGTSQNPVVLSNQFGVQLRHVHLNGDNPPSYSPSESKAVVTWQPYIGAVKYVLSVKLRGKTTCGELFNRTVIDELEVLPASDGTVPTWYALSDDQFAALPVARYTTEVDAVLSSGEHVRVQTPGDFAVFQLEDHDYLEASAPPDSRAPVLLVHGWTSNAGSTWYDASGSSPFVDELRQPYSPRHVWTLDYPNIDAIRISACGLAESVRYLRGLQSTPAKKVSLVAHSMGGLVCRAYLQDEVDPPNDLSVYPGFRNDVDRLVTLSTVHLGGALATIAAGLQDGTFQCSGALGSGSYYDLGEESTFVTEMMNRSLPDSVEYLFAAGTSFEGQTLGQTGYVLLARECEYPSDGVVTVCSATGGHCHNDGEIRQLNVGAAAVVYKYYDYSHSLIAKPGIGTRPVGDVFAFLRDGADAIGSEDCPGSTPKQPVRWQVWSRGYAKSLASGSGISGASVENGATQTTQQAAIPGTLVRIRPTGDPGLGGGLFFITDAEGKTDVGLPPGSYQVDFSTPGAMPRSDAFTLLPGGRGVSWPIVLDVDGAYVGPINPRLSIDEGRAATDDSLVSVGLSCERATQYKLSEDASFELVDWRPLLSHVDYLFDGTAGQKTLYARYKAADGSESNTVAASILLGTANTCRLSVSSTGANAKISLDSRCTGRSAPALFDSLSPGVHYVSAELSGMVADTATKVIVLQPGAEGSVEFGMTPAPAPPSVDVASIGGGDYWQTGPVSWRRPTAAGPGLLLYEISVARADEPDLVAWSSGAVADTMVVLSATLRDSTEYLLRLLTRDGASGVYADNATARSFYLDRTPPVVDVTIPSGRDTVLVGDSLMFVTHGADWGGLAQLRLFGSSDGGVSFADTLYSGAWADTVMWAVPERGGNRQLSLKIEGVDLAGNGATKTLVNVVTISDPLAGVGEAGATTFWLSPPWANPFSSSTSIRFHLPREEKVAVTIYDVAGRRIRTLVSLRMNAGEYSVRWDGRCDSGAPAGSGVYFCHMEAGPFCETKRVTLVR